MRKIVLLALGVLMAVSLASGRDCKIKSKKAYKFNQNHVIMADSITNTAWDTDFETINRLQKRLESDYKEAIEDCRTEWDSVVVEGHNELYKSLIQRSRKQIAENRKK